MKKSMTATEARKQFYAIINATENPGVSVIITHEGIPKSVVMSFEEFEGWQETMEIFSDSDATMDLDILKGISEMNKKSIAKDTVSIDSLKKALKL